MCDTKDMCLIPLTEQRETHITEYMIKHQQDDLREKQGRLSNGTQTQNTERNKVLSIR